MNENSNAKINFIFLNILSRNIDHNFARNEKISFNQKNNNEKFQKRDFDNIESQRRNYSRTIFDISNNNLIDLRTNNDELSNKNDQENISIEKSLKSNANHQNNNENNEKIK